MIMCCADKGTTVEVLALMGLFGLCWSSLQAVILERNEIIHARWTPQVHGSPHVEGVC